MADDKDFRLFPNIMNSGNSSPTTPKIGSQSFAALLHYIKQLESDKLYLKSRISQLLATSNEATSTMMTQNKIDKNHIKYISALRVKVEQCIKVLHELKKRGEVFRSNFDVIDKRTIAIGKMMAVKTTEKELSEKMKSLMEEKRAFEQEVGSVKELKSATETLKFELDLRTKELEETRAQRDQYLRMAQKYKGEEEEVRRQYNGQTDKILALNRELEENRKILKENEQKFEEYDKQSKEATDILQEKLNDAIQQKQALENQFSEKYRTLQQENENLIEKLEANNKEYNEKLKAANEKHEKDEQEIQILRQHVKSISDDNDILKSEICALKQENKHLLSEKATKPIVNVDEKSSTTVNDDDDDRWSDSSSVSNFTLVSDLQLQKQFTVKRKYFNFPSRSTTTSLFSTHAQNSKRTKNLHFSKDDNCNSAPPIAKRKRYSPEAELAPATTQRKSSSSTIGDDIEIHTSNTSPSINGDKSRR